MVTALGTSRMAAGSHCSATTSAPQQQCPGSISSPAHALVPPAAPWAQGRAWRGLRWHSSSCRNEPALFTQSSHWQSISSAQRLVCQHRHSSVPQSKASAAAPLRAGLCCLSPLLCWLLPPQACPFPRMEPGVQPWHPGHATLAVLCHSSCSWPCTGFFLLPSNFLDHFCSGVF